MQSQAGRRLEIGGIIQNNPLDDRHRQRTVCDQVVMKLAESEGGAFGVAVAA